MSEQNPSIVHKAQETVSRSIVGQEPSWKNVLSRFVAGDAYRSIYTSRELEALRSELTLHPVAGFLRDNWPKEEYSSPHEPVLETF